MSKDKHTELINIIGKASKTPQHELLVDFLNKYNLFGLREATVEQLQEYIDKYINKEGEL